MNALPPPPIESDVDLRDFAYMPLDVVRLRDSEISVHATGDEFRAAVLLWCASWHQIPAGSLPDDDAVLARFAGYGRVLKEWRKCRAGSMRGWVKHSDGRLYHGVVVEKAREAWEAKQLHSYRKACDRIRKHNKDHSENKPIPTYEHWVSSGKASVSEPTSAGIPAENALKGEVRDISHNKGLRETPATRDPVDKSNPGPKMGLEGQRLKALGNWRKVPDLAAQAAAIVGIRTQAGESTEDLARRIDDRIAEQRRTA